MTVTKSFLDSMVGGATDVNPPANVEAGSQGDTSLGTDKGNNEPPSGGTENRTTTETDANQQGTNSSTDTSQAVDDNALIARITNEAFSSVDGLNEFLGRREHFQGLESQLESSSKKIQELEGRPTFANDFIEKLNGLYLGGATKDQIDAFHLINSSGDLESLNPFELRKLSLMLNQKLTSEEADIYLEDKYELDEEVYDEQRVASSRVNLKIDAAKDLELLQSYKAKITESTKVETISKEAQEKEIESKKLAYLTQARPFLSQITNSFDMVRGVSINGKTGEDAFITDLPVSEESRAAIVNIVEDYALNNNIQMDSKGVEHLTEFAGNLIAMQNWRNWIADATAKTEQRMYEKFNNPANIDRGSANVGDQKSNKEKTLDWVVANS